MRLFPNTPQSIVKNYLCRARALVAAGVVAIVTDPSGIVPERLEGVPRSATRNAKDLLWLSIPIVSYLAMRRLDKLSSLEDKTRLFRQMVLGKEAITVVNEEGIRQKLSAVDIFRYYDLEARKQASIGSSLNKDTRELLAELYLNAIETGNHEVVKFVHSEASAALKDENWIKRLATDEMQAQKLIDGFKVVSDFIELRNYDPKATEKTRNTTGKFLKSHNATAFNGMAINTNGPFAVSFSLNEQGYNVNYSTYAFIRTAEALGLLPQLEKKYSWLKIKHSSPGQQN